MYAQPKSRNVSPTSMVSALTDLRCGSSIDSNIPLPQRAANRSRNGSSRPKDVMMVRNLTEKQREREIKFRARKSKVKKSVVGWMVRNLPE